MTTFALVHGAWGRGSGFDLLRGELEARGHRVVAPDLPCEDVGAGLDEYAAVVRAALGGVDDAVVVGHSLGGWTIPLVPARLYVFLCALVPAPERSVADDAREALADGFPGGVERHAPGLSRWVDLDVAVAQLYPDVPPELARAQAAALRPQARKPQVEPWPGERLPDGERTSILCRADACVRPDWSRRVARERLGVEAVELDGGHAPQLARAGELAELLCRL